MKDDVPERADKSEESNECDEQEECAEQENNVDNKNEKIENDPEDRDSFVGKRDKKVKAPSTAKKSRGTELLEDESDARCRDSKKEASKSRKDDPRQLARSVQGQKVYEEENSTSRLSSSIAKQKNLSSRQFERATASRGGARSIKTKKDDSGSGVLRCALDGREPQISYSVTSSVGGREGLWETATNDAAPEQPDLMRNLQYSAEPGSYRYREGSVQRLHPSKARWRPDADRPVVDFEGSEEESMEGSSDGGDNDVDQDPPRNQFVTMTDGVLVEEEPVVVGKVDRSRRRRIVRLTVLLLVVLVVVVVSVAVGVTLSAWQGSSGNATEAPTSSPTQAPTFAPKRITTTMVNAILNDTRLSNSTIAAMSEEGTPQFKAFQWLQSKAANQSSIPDDSNPIHRLTQQFALATLYYATTPTTGDGSAIGWTNSEGWLVDPDECLWFGCACTRTEAGSWALNTLELPQNELASGSLPTEVGLLDGLASLDLSGNAVAGSIPSDLGRLASAQNLVLSNNTFAGSIPTQLYQLTDLTLFDLDYNQLTGTVSASVGRLSKLTELNIWTNEGLTGSLPTELGRLTGLTRVYMLSTQFSGPRLSGPIPTELGNLAKLTNLVLTGYQFQGTIPTELSRLTLLDWLYLLRNELTGSIPSELGRLSKLGELDVSNNAGLTGTVPESLCSLIRTNNLVVKVSCDVINFTESCGCTCVA